MTCKPAFTEEFQEKLDDTRYANIRKRIVNKVILLCQYPLSIPHNHPKHTEETHQQLPEHEFFSPSPKLLSHRDARL